MRPSIDREPVFRVGTDVRAGRDVIHTTLLDLLLGIDEIAADEAESLATAVRLLRDGRVRLVGRESELEGARVIPRDRLRKLIRQICAAQGEAQPEDLVSA